MSRLMDMYGLVNYDKKTRSHDKSKSIYGSVLLDDISNYFEGIVRTYDEKKSFIVFGTFDQENGLQMYSCNEVEMEPVEILAGINSKRHCGNNTGRTKYAQFSNKNILIGLQDGEIYRDVTNAEVSLLKNKVEFLKRQCHLIEEPKQMKLK